MRPYLFFQLNLKAVQELRSKRENGPSVKIASREKMGNL